MKHLSVIIPCFNEQKYIGKCLDNLIEGAFDFRDSEILVVDGRSTDSTRAILLVYTERYPFIKMIDNPAKLKPIALNLGIKQAQGRIIMRIDAHASYAQDYVSKLVAGLESESVDNIGGQRDTYVPLDKGALTAALSIAISHPFAVGGATSRTTGLKEKALVSTVFCGCYRKDVFERIGYFNEALIRTQDREFNARLLEAGGKILLDPSIKCTYYSRGQLMEYLVWNFKGAFWLFYASKFTSVTMVSFRNLVPLAFCFYLIFAPLMGALIANPLITAILWLPGAVYLLALLISGLREAKKYQLIGLTFTLPVAIFLTHVTYGVASICGWVRSKIGRRKLKNGQSVSQ